MQGVLQAAKLSGAQALSKGSVAASRPTVSGFRPPVAPSHYGSKQHGVSVRPIAAAAAIAEPPPAVEEVPAREEPVSPRSINDATLQVKFVVPNAVAGAVLGRGGATVSAIKAKTGCYVQLTRVGTAVPDARERMLIVAGDSVPAVKEAVAMVLSAIVSEGQLDRLRWLRRHPQRVFLQQVIPATCAGKIMGPEGEQIKAIGQRTGCSVVVEGKPRNAAFVPFRMVNYLADSVEQIAAAVGDVLDSVVLEDKYKPGIQEITSVCMKIISVPQRKVGNLLGPGGMHIKSLQEVLKVKIGVADSQDASGTRYVTLWGPAQNMKVASDVIMLAAGTLQQAGAAERRPRSSARSEADDASSVAGSVAQEETQ